LGGELPDTTARGDEMNELVVPGGGAKEEVELKVGNKHTFLDSRKKRL
jgi:hypothetical protein